MIKIFAFFLLSLTPALALSKSENKLLANVVSKYFKHDGVHYHMQYMTGNSHAKLYEFTYVKWQAYPSRLTQADIRNGITKLISVRLTCDSAFRSKQNSKWSPWKEGGSARLMWFSGKIIYDAKGVRYVPNNKAMLKYYSKPRSSVTTATTKKRKDSDLPPGMTRIPAKK